MAKFSFPAKATESDEWVLYTKNNSLVMIEYAIRTREQSK